MTSQQTIAVFTAGPSGLSMHLDYLKFKASSECEQIYTT